MLNQLHVRLVRDLTIVDQTDGPSWVIACDSVGSIGSKPGDTYPATPATVAHFAARVPLVEILAAGATPVVVVDALCVEMDPTGKEMIAAIRELIAPLGLGPDRVTGSTEDNVPVTATGIGVTVLGQVTAERFRPGTAKAGERLILLGRPTSAPHDQIEIGDDRMISLETLQAVMRLDGVSDVLPVGSKGVAVEAGVLANTAGLSWQATVDHGVDLDRSGGPASCVIAAVTPEAIDALMSVLPPSLPRADIGVLA